MYDNKFLSLFKVNETEQDKHFQSYFLETSLFQELTLNQTNIVYGTKGSGKSALMIALTEIHKDNYIETYCINLKNLSFNTFYQYISEFSDLTDIELDRLANVVWRKTFVFYCLYVIYRSQSTETEIRNKIIQILNKFIIEEELEIEDISEGGTAPINAIQNLFHKFYNAPFLKNDIKKNSIYQDNLLKTHYFDKDIEPILRDVARKKGGLYYLLCLDGLDAVVDHTHISRKSIFKGLINSVIELRNDKLIASIFNINIFLPNELTYDSRARIWDIDKTKNITFYLRWGKEELEGFVWKRLLTISVKIYNKFPDIWNDYFPEKIYNDIHGIEENTFDYILRHTLFRPRQLQDHIFNLTRKWGLTGTSGKINSSFIPKIVRQTNLLLSEETINIVSYSFRNFEKFMFSFKGLPSVNQAFVIKNQIKNYLSFYQDDGLQDVNYLFEELLNFGILGIEEEKEEPVNSSSPSNYAGSKTKYFEFSFVGGMIHTRFDSEAINDDRLVAIAPMFREYCELAANSDFIVVPVQKGRKFWK